MNDSHLKISTDISHAIYIEHGKICIHSIFNWNVLWIYIKPACKLRQFIISNGTTLSESFKMSPNVLRFNTVHILQFQPVGDSTCSNWRKFESKRVFSKFSRTYQIQRVLCISYIYLPNRTLLSEMNKKELLIWDFSFQFSIFIKIFG